MKKMSSKSNVYVVKFGLTSARNVAHTRPSGVCSLHTVLRFMPPKASKRARATASVRLEEKLAHETSRTARQLANFPGYLTVHQRKSCPKCCFKDMR